MSITINWPPNNEADIASYELQRSPSLQTPDWSVLATVSSTQSGANWDAVNSVHTYLDATGTESHFYRLIAIDSAAQRSAPSTPFQPVAAQPAVPNNIRMDHNTGSPGALRYQTLAGVPVEGALVRVYLKTEFDLGRTETPLAVTLTNARGEWVNPVYVTTGFTYVVQFAKEGLYGPDKAEVTV